MKKLFLLGFALISMNAFCQNADFGLKAGLLYNTDNGVLHSIQNATALKGDGSAGFQAGAMVRIKLAGFYIQPELLYTNFNYKFKGLSSLPDTNPDPTPDPEPETPEPTSAKKAGEANLKLVKNRLDLPINIGKTFAMGLVHVQTGPVLSMNLDDKLKGDGFDFKKPEDQDKISLGWQVGAGVNISRFIIDLRYEFGLGKNSSKIFDNVTGTEFSTENRPNLLSLSVGYFF